MGQVFKQIWLVGMIFLLLFGTSLADNYTVTGAGQYPSANGTYVENGTDDGAPKYTKGVFTLERELGGMEEGWAILEGVTPIYRSYENPSPLVPVNNHFWYFLGGTSEPGLEITLAQPIPSLNEWGGILIIVVLSSIGIAVIRKKHFQGGDASA